MKTITNRILHLAIIIGLSAGLVCIFAQPKVRPEFKRWADSVMNTGSQIPETFCPLVEYIKECTPEWRLAKLIIDRVWIPPIRKDWKKVLYKKPTFDGFVEWLEVKTENEQFEKKWKAKMSN
jgi:hypothetical protein